ncbi:MAG TPA: DUF881 domain-containing protein [Mycobacteriales bacterium]|jgi:uncharacterized protein YlxW (UPF0749 family)
MSTGPAPVPAAPEPAGPTRPSGKGRRAGAWIGLLTALLGFAIAVQVKSTESRSALPTARQEDLVRILDDLSAREERLRREIADLQATRGQLTTGAAGADAALKETRRLTEQLGVLAGTVPATGPGVVITLTERGKQLSADTVLDAVEELRGAGAEAIQIGGQGGAVRVGTSTYFLDGDRGIVVDGTLLRGPYRIVAIGDAATLAAALAIPGGVVNTVEQASATAAIDQRRKVTISTLRPLQPPQYARPVS